MALRENSDIWIKSKSSQDQIAQYLVKAVLCLRDRDNLSESVRLFGCGAAIPNVILVAEIIRARFKGLSSIATLENMEKEKVEETGKQIINLPAIRIKLTCNPTQEELQQPGYQAPADIKDKDKKKFELFEYVMIYAKNLFFLKGQNRQRYNNNNNSNRHQIQQNEKSEKMNQQQQQQQQQQERQQYQERGQLKSRGNAQVQKRKPDEPEYKESDKRDDRDQIKNQRNNRQSNSNFQQQRNNDIRVKQGEIKTRGGNRR